LSEKKLVNVAGIASRVNMEMWVFPIFKITFDGNGAEVHELIGTGFFINEDGLFLTARHVIAELRNSEGRIAHLAYCVHNVDLRRTPVARMIDLDSLKTHRHTDIATGLVTTEQFGKPNTSITEEQLAQVAHYRKLTTDVIPVGTEVWTVAHPRSTVRNIGHKHVNVHLESEMYRGVVEEFFPNGRDNCKIPWPCYQTSIDIKGGASGGPVLTSGDGRLFAVNCSSLTTENGGPRVSWVSSLDALVNFQASVAGDDA
jgi:hypothetical protein